MVAKRVKIFNGRKNGEEPEYGDMDRISRLPDDIIHHILSFIPTIDAIRMSVVSKRWRYMWYSVPTLNLICDMFSTDGKPPNFNKFVDKCLKGREIGARYIVDSSVNRFTLDVPYYGGKNRVDKWLNFAVKNKVKELDLCITTRYQDTFYCLPEAIVTAQYLTFLKLDGLKIESPFQVSLPSLKVLFLKSISGLDDSSLEDLLVNCPSLETLVLKTCYQLSTPRVSSSSLKSFELDVPSLRTIRIDAISLHSFHISASRSRDISAAGMINLKSLSLFNVNFDAFWLKPFVPTLESLTISECRGHNHINIESQRLRNLVIFKGFHQTLDNITIDAPNLVSFTYKTHDIWPFDMSLKTPNLRVCNVYIGGQYLITYDSNWYVNLVRLLVKLSCCKKMCLHVDSYKSLIFPEDLRSYYFRSSLLALKHLIVKTRCPLSKKSELCDALQWLSPSLESLSIEQLHS